MRTNLPRLELLEDGSVFSTGDITKRDIYTLQFARLAGTGPLTALRLEVLPDERLPAGGPGRAYYEGRKGDFFLSEVAVRMGEDAMAHYAIDVWSKAAQGDLPFDQLKRELSPLQEDIQSTCQLHQAEGNWHRLMREFFAHQ